MPNLPQPEGMTFSDFGIAKVDTEPLPSLDIIGDGARGDLFYGTTENLKYAQGDVGAKGGHVTLLFGIHKMSGRPGAIRAVLGDWEPDDIEIEKVDHFPSSVEGEDYNVIVGKVKKTLNLRDARARLEVLPFSDKHADHYTPHVTIAYIKGSADLESWKSKLNKVYAGKKLKPLKVDVK